MVLSSAPTMISDEVSDRLIDAAIEVFAERGIEKAGVALIAERAGLTTGAIYNRWSGKHDLLLDALDVVLVKQVAELLSIGPDSQTTDVLETMGDELLRRDPASDAIVLEAVVMARRDPDFGEVFAARLDDGRQRLTDLIDQGKAAGAIDSALSTPAIVALCRSISLGFVVMSALGQSLVAAEEWNPVVNRLLTAATPTLPADEPATINGKTQT